VFVGGETTIEFEFDPVFHVYVPAPDADMVVVAPAQIVWLETTSPNPDGGETTVTVPLTDQQLA
jgi:hypothetical protein